MRGRWNLDEQELKYWQANALGQTVQMTKGELDLVDLTREDISPYQVNQVLTSLGWERYDEFNGLEGDRYAFYRHEGYRDIVLYGSILTFELVVYLKENFDKNDFKKEHSKKMLGED